SRSGAPWPWRSPPAWERCSEPGSRNLRGGHGLSSRGCGRNTPRQANPEHRPVGLRRGDADQAPVRPGDLLGDEEAEAEADTMGPGWVSISAPPERVEDERQGRRRDGLPPTGHFDEDLGLAAVGPQIDRGPRRAVLDRVAHEVAEQLIDPVAVPHAGQVPTQSDAKRAIRMRELRLADDGPPDLGHVDTFGIDGNAAPQPAPRQVEQLIDQARRHGRAPGD